MENAILSISLKEYKAEIDKLRASLLGLEETSEEYQNIASRIVTMQGKLNQVISVGKKNTDFAKGSYNELNQAVLELTRANKNLEGGLTTNNEQFRKNAERIAEMRSKLKEADAQMGLFQRNVGDYKNAFMAAFSQMTSGPVGLVQGLIAMGKELEGLKTRFGSVSKATQYFKTSIEGVNASLMKLIANPVGAVLALIGVSILACVAALKAFNQGVKSSEENTNKWNEILAKFQPLADICARLMQRFATALLDIAGPMVDVLAKTGALNTTFAMVTASARVLVKGLETVAFAINGIYNVIQPVLDKLNELRKIAQSSDWTSIWGTDEALELEQINDRLATKRAAFEKEERRVIEENATLQQKAAQAREEAFDKENNSVQQRIKYLKLAHQYEQEEIRNRIKIAKETLTISRLDAARSNNNSVINKMLSTQLALVRSLEAELNKNNTTYEKQLNRLNKEQAAQARAAANAAKKEEDRVTKQLQLEQKLLQMQIKGTKDGSKEHFNLEIELSNKSYQIEKRNIDKTVTDRTLRNRMIEALEVEHQKNLKQIRNDYQVKLLETYKVDYETQLGYAFKYSYAYDEIYKQMMEKRQQIFKETIKKNIDGAETFKKAMLDVIGSDTDVAKKIAKKYGNVGNFVNNEINDYIKRAESESLPFEQFIARIAERIGQVFVKAEDAAEQARKNGLDSQKAYQEEFERIFGSSYNAAMIFNATIMKLTDTQTSTIAKSVEAVKKEIEDEKILSKNWYAEQNKLATENDANRSKMIDKSLKENVVYYKKLSEAARAYYDEIVKNGKLSTETDAEFEKRKQATAKIVLDATKQMDEAFYEYAESQYKAAGYFDYLTEIEELEHKANMVKIMKQMFEEIQQAQEQGEDAILAAQQKKNQLIEEEEKRHSKKMNRIQNDIGKEEMKNWKRQVAYYSEYANSIGSLLDTVASYEQEELQRRTDNGELNEEQQKKEFERVKNTQVAAATVQMLAGAVGAYMQAVQTYPSPYGQILGGVNAALALATGHMQIDQIKKQEWGSNGSTSSQSTGAIDFSPVGVQPLLDENADAARVQDVNVIKDMNTGGDQRVYILQSDIEKSNRQVKVRESNSTF